MSDGSVIIDTSLDNNELKKQLKNLDSTISKASKGLSVSIGAISTAILGIGASALKFGDEYQQASNQLQASTGATTEEMNNLKEVMKDVYSTGLGENMNDVANAIATVSKEIKGLDDTSLKNVTEYAISMRDTFDYDVSESVRSAKALMDNFGISGEEAFNLIAQGSQEGLNYSGELLDNISEYSVQFGKLGFSAEDMFNIFASGAENGAFNLDKIGDAVKEFSIRAIDGSNTTIDGFTRLGLNADEMAQKFAQGGDVAREAFYQVVDGIAGMDDKVEQSKVGVELFGTMWEDLGPEVVTQLGSVKDAYDMTNNSAQQLTEIKYDNLGSAITGIGRQVQTGLLLPIAEKLMPAFNSLADAISQALASPEMQASINNIANSVGALVNGLAGFVEKHLPTLINLLSWIISNAPTLLGFLTAAKAGIAIFQNWDSIVKVATKSFELLNKVLKGNPIMIVVGLIITFISYLVNLYNTNEDFRNKVNEVWNNVKNTIMNVVNGIKSFVTEKIPQIVRDIINWFKELPRKYA